MKIYNHIKLDIDTWEVLEEDSYDYIGEIARCGWEPCVIGAAFLRRADLIFDQVTPASTWNIEHDMNTYFLLVQVYDDCKNHIFPTEIYIQDADNVRIEFDHEVVGTAHFIYLQRNVIYLAQEEEDIMNMGIGPNLGYWKVGDGGSPVGSAPTEWNPFTNNDLESPTASGAYWRIYENDGSYFLDFVVPWGEGLTIREVGIFNINDDLLFYSKCSELYKPETARVVFNYQIEKLAPTLSSSSSSSSYSISSSSSSESSTSSSSSSISSSSSDSFSSSSSSSQSSSSSSESSTSSSSESCSSSSESSVSSSSSSSSISSSSSSVSFSSSSESSSSSSKSLSLSSSSISSSSLSSSSSSSQSSSSSSSSVSSSSESSSSSSESSSSSSLSVSSSSSLSSSSSSVSISSSSSSKSTSSSSDSSSSSSSLSFSESSSSSSSSSVSISSSSRSSSSVSSSSSSKSTSSSSISSV